MKVGLIMPNMYRDTRALTAVGIQDLIQGRVTDRGLYDAQRGQANLQANLELAREYDNLGFDHISVSEHHFSPLLQTPNAAVFAAALSQVVKRAKIAWLGPIASISNPVKVAEEIAMLDQLTGGNRLLVYVLKGTPNEHLYYKMQWDEARARCQEAALLIKKALTEPHQFSWDGEFWKFDVISVWPGATTRPHPPIYTSGSQAETFEFAAAHGFGIATGGSLDYLRTVIAQYREAARAAGWTPTKEHVLVRGVACVGESKEHAAQLRATMFPDPSHVVHAASVGSSSPHEEANAAAADPNYRPAVPPFPVLLDGDAKTVIEQARELSDAGIGILDLVTSFGGLTLEEERGVVRRLGALLPQIQAL